MAKAIWSKVLDLRMKSAYSLPENPNLSGLIIQNDNSDTKVPEI